MPFHRLRPTQRASLRSAYRGIMRQLLLLCGFVACLLPQTGAARTGHDASMREGPIAHALRALGTRYRYGGASPEAGFDCSGLITHVFEQAGLSLPRTAR